jgi:hypothetical protein
MQGPTIQNMRRLLEFTIAVVRHWGALVTGGVLIGALGTWQSTGHTVKPWVYWLVAIVALFVAFFRAWKDKAEQLDGASANKTKPIGSSEWRDLADRFAKTSIHVRADWQQFGGDSGIESWSIGGSTIDETYECKVLCSLAGAMLIKSVNVSKALSDRVRSQRDEADRWLGFLKEYDALSDISYCIETLNDGSERPIFLGSIRSIAKVSARACIECSAREI